MSSSNPISSASAGLLRTSVRMEDEYDNQEDPIQQTEDEVMEEIQSLGAAASRTDDAAHARGVSFDADITPEPAPLEEFDTAVDNSDSDTEPPANGQPDTEVQQQLPETVFAEEETDSLLPVNSATISRTNNAATAGNNQAQPSESSSQNKNKSGPGVEIVYNSNNASVNAATGPSVSKGGPQQEDEDEDITFSVKTPSGKEFSMKQMPTCTILEVKQTLAKLNDVLLDPTEIKLIFKGKPLTDGAKTIADVGITTGAKIIMLKQLYGAQNNSSEKRVGAKIEVTDPKDRGFIHITIPQGARPGNRLIIHPPGRSRMIVYVPRGHGPGDQLRVQLPDETPSGPPADIVGPASPAAQVNTSARAGRGGADRNFNGVVGPLVLLKAVCPNNVTPGAEILVNVPSVGAMKVTVPQSARPGQPFHFRVLPNF